MSATSIGTEENSLGVPRAQSGALIYMRESKHRQRDEIQVQRDASLLSKYSYKKGNGHQEASEQRVSINESIVRKSSMSHALYSKQLKGRNRNTTPLSRCEDCDFTFSNHHRLLHPERKAHHVRLLSAHCQIEQGSGRCRALSPRS